MFRGLNERPHQQRQVHHIRIIDINMQLIEVDVVLKDICDLTQRILANFARFAD